ncbi:MAG: relaxase/mobilization nuclease domain-containing protein [Acidimicrobiales bacterium]|nr:relaxase/mobilization nuclease domain-containing protein [Acidimicrobiales bacterium]
MTVIWPKALVKQIIEPGDLEAEQVNQIARRLAERLPPA